MERPISYQERLTVVGNWGVFHFEMTSFFFFLIFFQSGRANLSVELVRAKESWRLEPSRIDLKQKEEGGSAGCKRGSCWAALRVCPMKLKT